MRGKDLVVWVGFVRLRCTLCGLLSGVVFVILAEARLLLFDVLLECVESLWSICR